MSLSIGYRDREYKVDLSRNEEYNFSVNVGKCKKLYTNNLIFSDGVEIGVDLVETRGVYGVYRCADAELVGDERAGVILERVKDKGVEGVVAFSLSDSLVIKTAGGIPFYEAVRIAAGYIYSSSGRYPSGKFEAVINGTGHKILFTRNGTLFYPEIKYIS